MKWTSTTKTKNTSIKENQWLDYLENEEGILMYRDLDGNRNYKLKDLGISVDGRRFETDKDVFMFLGDWFHGNLNVFHKGDIQYESGRHSGLTFEKVNKKTMDEIKHLKSAGYNVTYIWESDWDK